MRKAIIYGLAAVLLSACIAENPIDSYRHSYKEKEEAGGGSGSGENLFAGGDGSEGNPYILKTADHLVNMRKALVEDDMVYFRMEDDIDMLGRAWTPLNYKDPYSNFIGFDGGGHVIRNLACKNVTYASFAGVLCGWVRNLGIVNADILSSGGAGIIGGYVGLQSPKDGSHTGTVENCYVSGTVQGTYAGGICGRLGASSEGEICAVRNCWSSARVNATTKEAGGIAGNTFKDAVISRCVSRGTVTAAAGGSDAKAGGIAAYAAASSVSIRECVSWNWSIQSSYQAARIATGSGALADNLFWKKTNGTLLSGSGSTDVLSWKILETMKSWGDPWTDKDGSVILPLMASHEGLPADTEPEGWADPNPSESDTEPGEDPGPGPEPGEEMTGSGTEADPYRILSAAHLQSLGEKLLEDTAVYAVLGADIDLAGVDWQPLCTSAEPLKVLHLDGGGHTIAHLRCTASSFPSLLGVFAGEVKNLIFSDAAVSSTGRQAGILAGLVTGTGTVVRNVTAQKSGVTGADRVGGIAGQVDQEVLIEGCTASDVTVTGTYNVGGIAGVLYGTASGCSVSGSVKGTSQTGNNTNAGGIAGFMQYGKIEKCAAKADVNVKYRGAGGLVGYVTGVTSGISDSFAAGKVHGNQRTGGLVGEIAEGTTCAIARCYASGAVDLDPNNGSAGGLVGVMSSVKASAEKCVAWNSSVSGTTAGDSWSSGAVVGVAHPKCTLTDNYRNPEMILTAWWVPDADFQHANVSAENPLTVKDKTTGEIRPTTATSTASGQDNRPQYAYHGKVNPSATLSALAQDTLLWDTDTWDFTGDMPVLK